MSFWSSLLKLFTSKPKPPSVYKWDLGLSVLPPEAVADIQVGDQTFLGQIDGSSGHRLFHFSSPTPKEIRNLPATLTVTASGWRPKTIAMPNIGDKSHEEALIENPVRLNRHQAQVMRAPLPALPAGSYDHDLPVFPTSPDLLFYRGNFCGIRVPGVPGVPGGVNATVPGGDTSLVMASHLDRYPIEWQHRILETYASYGYTHFQQSIGFSEDAGKTIPEYVATAKLIQSYGLYVDHWFLGAGKYNTRDMDRTYWAPILQPWFDGLFAQSAVDACCVGWQLDGFNKEDAPIQSIIDYFAEQCVPRGIPLATHWINGAGTWTATLSREQWWRNQKGKLSWFHHQGPTASQGSTVPDYQARLCDTLNPFGNGRFGTSGLFGDRPFGLVVYECSAQDQYDERSTEAEGDQRGMLLCCTKASAQVSGYGNGARRQDGGPV